MDYENIVLISHEDTTKDITRKSGDKITSIKPNIADKVANKIAGMVDIVARVVVEDDDSRTLNFKSNEVIFGGGRLKGITKTQIPLDWDALCEVYDEANQTAQDVHSKPQTAEKAKVEDSPTDEENGQEKPQDKPQRTSRRATKTAPVADVDTGTGTVVGAMNPPETDDEDEGADSEQGESDVQDAQKETVKNASPSDEAEKPARTRRTRKARGTE